MSEVLEAGGVTAGALLRDAREAAGVHIAALAVALKVPVSKLEALETDNYEALPDTVFVRALASSVCRTLKMEPGPVLALLPQSKNPRLSTDGGGLNAPVKGPAGKSSSSFASRSTHRPVGWIVLALLVGALGLVFYPRQSNDTTGSHTTPPSEAPADASVLLSPDTSGAKASEPLSTPPVGAPLSAPRPPPEARNDVAAASTALLTTSAASPSRAPASAAVAPEGLLVLRARGETWVQVRDAKGAVALQRSLGVGESVSVPGPAPLAVVVGRADMTEVVVRGKVFDLTAVSRENVARFEVK